MRRLLKRWGARDGFGQALMAACDEIGAPDDRTLFRLKHPSLCCRTRWRKTPPSMCPIMPERLATTDPISRSPRWSAAARTATRRMNVSPVRWWSTSATLHYVPRADGMPMAPPGRRSLHSTGSSGTSSPIPATVAGGAAGRGDRLVADAGCRPVAGAAPAAESDRGNDLAHRFDRHAALQPSQSAVRQSGDPARDHRRGVSNPTT